MIYCKKEVKAMAEIEKIGTEYIEYFAEIYEQAKRDAGKEPLLLSEKKRKKLQNDIFKFYEEAESFPDEISKEFKENCLGFLSLCETEAIKRRQTRQEEFDEACVLFDGDVKSAFKEIIGSDLFYIAKQTAEETEFIIEDISSFGRSLILEDLEKGDIPDMPIIFCSLKKFGDKFCLYGAMQDYDDCKLYNFEIKFSSAKCETKIYDCSEDFGYAETAWNILYNICAAIKTKNDSLHGGCNDKEKELLPLIEEIVALFDLTQIKSECEFKELKSIAQKHDCKKLLQKIIKTEKKNCGTFSRTKNAMQLIYALNNKKYENIWREIYDKLQNSQSEYVKKSEALCPPNILKSAREKITEQMNLLGYKGNYPNFYKDGEILRPHLAKSYETVYLVGREKNVKHIVHCFESCDKESLNIFLLCGTALLKKGEEATDIISCLFNAKGRRIFSGISQYIPFEDYEKNIDELNLFASAAAKKSELKKLSKKEKEICGRITFDNGCLYYLILGILFSLAFNICFFIFAFLLCLIFTSPKEAFDVMLSLPWLGAFLFAAIAFAGATALTDFLSNHNR